MLLREEWGYLAADDGDGGESFPQGALAAMIAQDGARPLDPVHEADQALHGRHCHGEEAEKARSEREKGIKIKCKRKKKKRNGSPGVPRSVFPFK